MIEALSGALRRIGFEAVFDTAFTADLTIMEEVSELIERCEDRRRPPHVHPAFTGLGAVH
jgi:iron only hydrogenase large subunit-like protein